MPCMTYYDDNPEDYYGPKLKSKDAEIEKLKKQVSFAESALCATLNSLESVLNHDHQVEYVDPLDYINYPEAGITKPDLKSWRKRHAELDKKHRAKEKERLIKEALAKLSDSEKDALGLK